ncbi:MAG TPA: hypothetical protein VFW78_03505 [Bacteroidia bacterium]|nr:hypothetical protein [Bacteroidia bacterium]
MKTALHNSVLMLMCCVLSATTHAQTPVAGITGGASINYVRLEGLSQVSTDLSSVKGFEGGAYLSFDGPGIYVRPMVLASFLRGNLQSENQEAPNTQTDFEFTTLEVPVICGLNILPAIAIEGGPSWNYLMSYTKNVGAVNVNLNRNALGYRLGVRVKFVRLGIYAHYGGIVDSGNNDNYSLERPSRILIGATWDLGGGR